MQNTLRRLLLSLILVLGSSTFGAQEIYVENGTWLFLKITRVADPSVAVTIPPQNIDKYPLPELPEAPAVQLIYPDGFALREDQFQGFNGKYGVNMKIIVKANFSIRIEYLNNNNTPTPNNAGTNKDNKPGAVTTGTLPTSTYSGGGRYGGGYGGYGNGTEYKPGIPNNSVPSNNANDDSSKKGSYVSPESIKKNYTKGLMVKIRAPEKNTSMKPEETYDGPITMPDPPPVVRSINSTSKYLALPSEKAKVVPPTKNEQLMTTILWSIVSIVIIFFIVYKRIQAKRSGV